MSCDEHVNCNLVWHALICHPITFCRVVTDRAIVQVCVTFAMCLIANCKQWKNDWPRVCLLSWKKNNATHALRINWWKLIEFFVMDACNMKSMMVRRMRFLLAANRWRAASHSIYTIYLACRVSHNERSCQCHWPIDRHGPLCSNGEVQWIKCDVDASAPLWKINVNATNGKLRFSFFFVWLYDWMGRNARAALIGNMCGAFSIFCFYYNNDDCSMSKHVIIVRITSTHWLLTWSANLSNAQFTRQPTQIRFACPERRCSFESSVELVDWPKYDLNAASHSGGTLATHLTARQVKWRFILENVTSAPVHRTLRSVQIELFCAWRHWRCTEN